MSYMGGDNLSGYAVRFGAGYKREDADGRTHIWARAISGATALVPHILYPYAGTAASGGIGYYSTVPFSTGLGSVSSACAQNAYFVGINNDTVASNTDAWFQVGGPIKGMVSPSVDFSLNGMVQWRAATITATTAATITAWSGTFGLSMSSISQGTYDVYLLNTPVCGIG
jgi:hypothetical protein